MGSKLSKSQRKVLAYLGGAGHASERLIAQLVFDAPKNSSGKPMLLGVPAVMRALEGRGLVACRTRRSVFGDERAWEITDAGRKELA